MVLNYDLVAITASNLSLSWTYRNLAFSESHEGKRLSRR